MAVDWTFTGPDVVASAVAGLAVLVSSGSVWYARKSVRESRRAADAADRSADAEEAATAIARSRRRDELLPKFAVRTRKATDRGLSIDCIDLTVAGLHGVRELEVTLLRPDDGQGYVADRIMNLSSGVIGGYGEPVPYGDVVAGGTVRVVPDRAEGVHGRLNLQCSCTVEGEPFTVLVPVTYGPPR